MKDDTLQRNNTGFLVGLVHHITWRWQLLELQFIILIKCKISCVKNFISVRMKPFGRNKKCVTCKSPDYQAIQLNPTTRCKIIFKINPIDRVFSTWRIEGSPPLLPALAKSPPPRRLTPPKVHRTHWITIFKL